MPSGDENLAVPRQCGNGSFRRIALYYITGLCPCELEDSNVARNLRGAVRKRAGEVKKTRFQDSRRPPGDLFLEFEHFLSSVFGKAGTHGLVGYLRDNWSSEWLARLLAALRQYVAHNTTRTDRLHREELLRLCDRARTEIRRYRQRDERAAFAVLMLSRVVFELLGEQPRHWARRRVNRPEHWRLDARRALAYSQSPQQKINAIEDAIWRLPDRQDRAEELREKMRRHPNDPESILAWVRQAHPKLYLELF
jgi:hypothetical protein